jgi:hypothetical protein
MTDTFAAPYDFATLKQVILKIDPQQSKPVNRGEVIQAWATAGASDKAQRNKALKQYTADALVLGTDLKMQLGETPVMLTAHGAPANPNFFGWIEGQDLFCQQLMKCDSEKGKWYKHPAGFFFKFLVKGSGEKSPEENDPAKCHYEGKLVTGTVFDSSFKRQEPAVFAPAQVIQSWKIMLQLLRGGDVVEIIAPPALAYGSHEQNAIPANSVLIFKIALIEVLGGKGKDAAISTKILEAVTKKKYDEI